MESTLDTITVRDSVGGETFLNPIGIQLNGDFLTVIHMSNDGRRFESIFFRPARVIITHKAPK